MFKYSLLVAAKRRGMTRIRQSGERRQTQLRNINVNSDPSNWGNNQDYVGESSTASI